MWMEIDWIHDVRYRDEIDVEGNVTCVDRQVLFPQSSRANNWQTLDSYFIWSYHGVASRRNHFRQA